MQTRIDVSHPHGLPHVPLRILQKVGIFGLEENIVLYVSSGVLIIPIFWLQKVGIFGLEENIVLYVSSSVLIIPIFWTGRYDVRHIPSLPVEALIAFESNENNQNFCPTLRVSLTQTG